MLVHIRKKVTFPEEVTHTSLQPDKVLSRSQKLVVMVVPREEKVEKSYGSRSEDTKTKQSLVEIEDNRHGSSQYKLGAEAFNQGEFGKCWEQQQLNHKITFMCNSKQTSYQLS
jgi:hypothetical protein